MGWPGSQPVRAIGSRPDSRSEQVRKALVRKLVRTEITHLHAHFSRTNARFGEHPIQAS